MRWSLAHSQYYVDAEAICEAASRPSMRFVKPRTESQLKRKLDEDEVGRHCWE